MIPLNVYKKRIVLLTDCLSDLAGGAEKQIFELARGLDKNKFDVHVVSLDCSGKTSPELIETTGSQLHIFRVVRIYGISGLSQGLRFKRFLDGNRIDILMTYHFSSDIWGTFWGHFSKVKTIISNRRDMGFWRHHFHVAAYRLINSWVDKIVTNSKSIKDMVITQEGVSFENVQVIYNGVGLPPKVSAQSQELRARLGLKSTDIVIMHVANLKPIKGHQYLLKAFAAIATSYPQAKLVLIGRDELNGQLQKMARDLNILDKVLFLGLQNNVQGLLTLTDICVLPSLSEGMSNAILEYMAAQKPVIATRVGGNPELVKNDFNGLLVEKKNVQELKEALLKLLGDKEKRHMMGHNGLGRVKTEFSMESMIENYERIFKAPRRVLHLISSGGLFGAERVVLNLADKSEGIIPFVGAINNTHNPHLEIIEEAKRLGLKTVVFNSKGKIDIGTVGAIKKFIIENKIDIVHTHNYKSDFIGALAARLGGAKWMATHHGFTADDQRLGFYEKIDSFILKLSQKVVFVSQRVKQNFLHLNKGHLEVIDNGVPIEKFDRFQPTGNARSLIGISLEDCAIVIVGRLSHEKGHEVFLQAACEVVKKVPKVKFIIVGDGPLREELEQKARYLNLSEYVVFTGIREDMPAIYAACDIMVNSSYAEGMPMTILEAMASHLPVIATDVGAVGEVINTQENGILIQPGDVGQLALSMIELARDKERRQRFAQKAYQDVRERFSDEVMACKYKQVYEDVLSG